MANDITVIEVTANIIYLIFVGDKASIEKIIKSLTNNKTDIKYFSIKIDTPIAEKCNELSIIQNKQIFIDLGIEVAQCYTYAEGFNKNNYIILTLNDNIISYPKIEIKENNNVEKIIYAWLNKNLINIPKSIKETLKPLTMVGNNDNIIVFLAKIKY